MSKFTDWHLYVGCEAMYEIYDSKILGKITQHNTESGLSTLNWEGGSISKYAHEFKLVLRRIKSMTIEEQREEYLLTRFCESDTDSSGRQGMARGFQYLLSKGFDLFGLVDSGQAIDKATLDARKQSTE
jgi:hypothetical protein